MSLQTFYPKQTVGMLPSAAVSAVSFPVFLSHSLVLLVFTFHNLRLNVSILHNEKRKKKSLNRENNAVVVLVVSRRIKV